jgi:hypothetical protein
VKSTNRSISILGGLFIIGLLVALTMPFATRRSNANQKSYAPAPAPYPASPVVSQLIWDSRAARIGDGTTGDNWPITWGDDDMLYAAYGDGDGFSNRSPKLSLGFTKLSGEPPDISGQDFSSNIDTPEGQGPNGIKASGMLMVDGTLYLFVRNYKPAGSGDYTNSRLAWSNDHGRTWTWANWHFADTFGAPDFIQFGKNYSGARDNYVYVVSQANDSAYGWSRDVVMARVPTNRVADRAAYEFFAGLGGNNAPQWSSDIAQRKPVFTDTNGVQRIGMTYNAGLHRYFLTSAHQVSSGATHTPALGVFDAPEPWGPWSTVYYDDNFSGGYAFHHKFPSKWMSADGQTMWLLYSGSNTGSSCNCVTLRKATLVPNGAPPTPMAPPATTATPTNGPPPPASSAGLQGDYFGDPTLTALKLRRTDATVNFDWGTGAVTTGLGPDNFSVRWTGQVTPRFSENYTFFTQSDDGVRLWINGQLIVDDWNQHATSERAGTIALQAGQRYSLRLEYFEYNVDATVRLLWSSPSQPKEIVPQSQLSPPDTSTPLPTPIATPTTPSQTATPSPTLVPPTATIPTGGSGMGLTGAYYGDSNFGTLKMTRTDPMIAFAWSNGAPDPSLPTDNFTVHWAGQIIPRFSEVYTFRITADDGARLWINGQLVVDGWAGAYGGQNGVPVTLQAGQPYDLRLDYREDGGSASIKLEWSSPSQPRQIVPQSQLRATAASATPTSAPPTTATPTTTATLTPAGVPKLLFGLGAEADSALQARLVQEAPVRMLTSWYNGPNDLTWMTAWQNDLVPNAYQSGYAMHLIVFSDTPESQIQTQFGMACGRPYPLSERFLDDMRLLAQTFAGTADGPPLYVTLFTEFQTYACSDNAWNPDAPTTAYYQALKARYLAALALFHQHAPNARVSLGWGGWQTRWDDPASGGGRSMFAHFTDVLRASDFQSFQAMQSDSNVADVRAMVQVLGAYGPVMLAHYKPDNASQAIFDEDTEAMFTDSYLSELIATGLFAWSFMDQANLSSDPSYVFVKSAVQRYGATVP